MKLNEQEKRDMDNNCRKATMLFEKSQLGEMTSKEKALMDYHMNICSMCRLFAKQSLLINQSVKKWSTKEAESLSLDEEFKKKLRESMGL